MGFQGCEAANAPYLKCQAENSLFVNLNVQHACSLFQGGDAGVAAY